MKKKKNPKPSKIILTTIVALVLLLIIGIIIQFNNNKRIDKISEIPQNFIAIFHGGEGKITYETYIYKIKNGQSNYGFKYINVMSTKKYWFSKNWRHKITDSGKFAWTDEAFNIAQKNGAYSYVTMPNSDDKYTIEQFQNRFILN